VDVLPGTSGPQSETSPGRSSIKKFTPSTLGTDIPGDQSSLLPSSAGTVPSGHGHHENTVDFRAGKLETGSEIPGSLTRSEATIGTTRTGTITQGLGSQTHIPKASSRRPAHHNSIDGFVPTITPQDKTALFDSSPTLLSQVDALATDQNGFMPSPSRQSPDITKLLKATMLNSIQVQSSEFVLGDQSQSKITDGTVNEDGSPVTKVELKHALSLMTIPDINLIPTTMQDSFSHGTASVDQSSYSTLFSVKQVGNGAVGFRTKLPKTITSLLTTEELQEKSAHMILPIVQNWTEAVTNNNTTGLIALNTLMSASSNAQGTVNITVGETSPSSPTATEGLSNSQSGMKSNIIISVSVVSATAFLSILIFVLAQRQRKRRDVRRAQLARHQESRQYDPNCSYFSLDSTVDS
jgi:hypothetical protein